ncbi:hypothetical protein GCM10010403_31130 [Glycomyces rutgersensis]|uniref:Uncharacterized protein n=1 Tax=Glycomyces rutgersensis TaxID=58115 RepID=A0ABP5SR61_9ACTN
MTVCGRSRHGCPDAAGTPNTGRLANSEPPVNNPAAGVRQFRVLGSEGVTEDTGGRVCGRTVGGSEGTTDTGRVANFGPPVKTLTEGYDDPGPLDPEA